jgi:hypothetical protein
VRENLFAQGVASTTDDPETVKAALARPGVVLSRPIGGDSFTVEAAPPPTPPKTAPPRSAKARTMATPAPKPPPPPPPPPDRKALGAAERALDELDAEARRADDAIRQERKALEARAAGQQRTFATRRRRLERERDRALAAYRRAGGR